ncbi:hypothetical protein ACNGWJ_005139, partial [Escherichia coli]
LFRQNACLPSLYQTVISTIRQFAVQYIQEVQIMPSATQTARLEARISTELHAMLKRAAEIQVKKGALRFAFATIRRQISCRRVAR